MTDSPPDARRQLCGWLAVGVLAGQMLVMVTLIVMWDAYGGRAALAAFVAVLGGQLWAVNLGIIRARDRAARSRQEVPHA